MLHADTPDICEQAKGENPGNPTVRKFDYSKNLSKCLSASLASILLLQDTFPSQVMRSSDFAFNRV